MKVLRQLFEITTAEISFRRLFYYRLILALPPLAT
jgi:hypothetical protein